MIPFLLLFLQLLLLIYVFRRIGGFSVPFILAGYSLLSILSTLFVSSVNTINWYAGSGFQTTTLSAILIFSFFCVLSVLSSNKAIGAGRGALGRVGTLGGGIGGFVLAGNLLVSLVLLLHVIRADWSSSWLYFDYMSSRSPEFYGVDDWLGRFTMTALKLMGLFVSFSVGYSSVSRYGLLIFMLSLFSFLVITLMHIVMGSKFIVMMFALLFGTLYASSDKRWRIPVSLLGVGLGCWIFLVCLAVRYSRFYGLGEFFSSFTLVDVIGLDYFVRLAHLLFGGITVLDFSIRYDFSYEFMEKVVSMSPLISAVDGYDKYFDPGVTTTLQYWETGSGAIWAPVSGLGQLYHFGLIFFLVFSGVFSWAVYRAERVRLLRLGAVGIIPMGLFLIGFVVISMYPLRNGFRFIVISIVVSYLLESYQRNAKKQGQSPLKRASNSVH